MERVSQFTVPESSGSTNPKSFFPTKKLEVDGKTLEFFGRHGGEYRIGEFRGQLFKGPDIPFLALRLNIAQFCSLLSLLGVSGVTMEVVLGTATIDDLDVAIILTNTRDCAHISAVELGRVKTEIEHFFVVG